MIFKVCKLHPQYHTYILVYFKNVLNSCCVSGTVLAAGNPVGLTIPTHGELTVQKDSLVNTWYSKCAWFQTSRKHREGTYWQGRVFLQVVAPRLSQRPESLASESGRKERLLWSCARLWKLGVCAAWRRKNGSLLLAWSSEEAVTNVGAERVAGFQILTNLVVCELCFSGGFETSDLILTWG